MLALLTRRPMRRPGVTRRVFEDARDAAARARARPDSAFPGHAARRQPFGLLIPPLSPRFTFEPRGTVFTVGSCFSRNIEEALVEQGMHLPTTRFHCPRSEWPWRHNGLLNEYNPGSIAQRIHHALDARPLTDETLIDTPGGVLDLLLPSPHHARGVSRARARARRAEIDAVYADLAKADVLIITLGMVEAWFDRATGLFLNRKPPGASIETEPGRFAFCRLGVADVLALLEPALAAVLDSGVPRVLLAVSPVPLNTSFSGREGFVANMYSKSVLRAAAEVLLADRRVDYLPSYEIVTSGGPAVFTADNMHVRDEVVRQVVDVMLAAYTTPPPDKPSSTNSQA